ncbi:asparaginase [Ideonella sp. B7]|uniref:asparaginase n=1 Tax=Ideonella benzenivorans TaxID=2831643 RepID=UPI001CED4CA4|nr:asparaginase [Ideonella benzenivorans]MCA6217818.1 asparaginase [Ideonella benzenivorans]
MPSNSSGHIVILGTGGTIAGTAAAAADNVGYQAGQLGVAQLVAAVPALAAHALEARQLAQVDSKDMSHALWQQLAAAVAEELAREDVQAVVVTHGTDTLEETAWFLHRVLAATKPVVLTAAMRPASALMPDGPQNLLDAVTVAATPGTRGVLCVLAGRVLGPEDVRKVHGYRVDAFAADEAGPVALVQEGQVRALRAWPQADPGEAAALQVAMQRPVAQWPRVDIVTSHAGCDGALVPALVALGSRGLVAEGTGNGTLHAALEVALRVAQAQGVAVWRASRCWAGGVVGQPEGALPSAGVLTPAKARVELMLQLMLRA